MKKTLMGLMVVSLSASFLMVPASAGGPDCTIEGTEDADVLVGTSGNDVICGYGKADTIKGMGGNDKLYGGPANDKLIGGEGNDRLFGERHVDTLKGGSGNDFLRGNGPPDEFHEHNTLIGGSGDDEIVGNTEGFFVDTLMFKKGGAPIVLDLRDGTVVGQGNDTLSGVFGEIWGTNSDDRLIAKEKSSETDLLGLRGADYLRGNLMHGGRGNDVLQGTRYVDIFDPGFGNDTMTGGASEELTPSMPRDEIDFNQGPVTVEVTPNEDGESDGTARGEGRDVFTSIRSFLLTAEGDHFFGDGRPNHVLGEGGGDVIEGSGHQDRLRGGKGEDEIRGQKGEDYLDGGDDDKADLLHGGKQSDTCVQNNDDIFKSCETME